MQVAKTRLLKRERDEQARRQIATVVEVVMMIVAVLTYGRSAWCGPLLCVWMELWVLLMEMIVGDGGVVDAEWMRSVRAEGERKI